MSKLREKIENAFYNPNPTKKLEQINDDFAVKFVEWHLENCDYYYTENRFMYNNNWHSLTELLQIFKDNFYE